MHPRTAEFLNFLLWNAHRFSNPTFSNLTGSYEQWAGRWGFDRQMARLHLDQLVSNGAVGDLSDDRLCRLTDQGRLQAWGGRDPERQWNRKWDGRWRMALFDVPMAHNSRRARLRRYLRGRYFGCLQNSVWITPDPLDLERKSLAGGGINVETLLLLDARPCSGESDSHLVQGAWDFPRINRLYERHLEILDQRPTGSDPDKLRPWARMEMQAWFDVVRLDPLLPASLLPAGYLGQRAWKRRRSLMEEHGRSIRPARRSRDNRPR